jgi:uncharacterized repeat protein (TIGR03803 family)
VFLLVAATPVATLAQTQPLVQFGGTNGAFPTGPLTLGPDGNYYGTTNAGFQGASLCNIFGDTGCGTIFKMTPTGTFTPIYNFTGGTDGAGPIGGLLLASDKNFYGMTNGQYGLYGSGTIFQYVPGASAPTTLYTFMGAGDGGNPMAGPIQGTDGNLYGTTSTKGTFGNGTAFSPSPPFTPGQAAFNVLYDFCQLPLCADGGTPFSATVSGRRRESLRHHQHELTVVQFPRAERRWHDLFPIAPVHLRANIHSALQFLLRD